MQKEARPRPINPISREAYISLVALVFYFSPVGNDFISEVVEDDIMSLCDSFYTERDLPHKITKLFRKQYLK